MCSLDANGVGVGVCAGVELNQHVWEVIGNWGSKTNDLERGSGGLSG
jgi:hypothetical protein